MPARGRPPLSRARVLRAGIALADAEGLDAVTMRRLAETLGVVPMALYKHVSDKEDLLDGIVDTLIEDFPAPSPVRRSQWQQAVRETLHGARHVVTGHPWARRALESRTLRTPAVLGHMERVSRIFLDAGFTPDLTHHVMHLLGNRIWGFSPELFPGEPASGARDGVTRRSTAPVPDPADYPAIVAVATDAQARRPDATGCDEDFEFDFALDLILDGVARLRRGRWSSTAHSPRRGASPAPAE